MGMQVISYQVIKEIIQEHRRILLYLMAGILIISLLFSSNITGTTAICPVS